MKRLILIFVILVSINNIIFPQIQTIWQKSSATNNLPGWFSATESSETGIAYRQVNGQNHLYVVSNKGGVSEIIVLDADNGDSLGKLNTTGISGGTYKLFDVESGFQNFGILACNLTTNPTTDPFKIYAWESETSVPRTLIIDSTSSGIWGEKFSAVWGMFSGGIFSILTIGKNNNRMIIYNNYWGDTVFTRQVITLPFLFRETILLPLICIFLLIPHTIFT